MTNECEQIKYKVKTVFEISGGQYKSEELKMIGKFLIDQIVYVMQNNIDSAWNQIASAERKRKQKIYLEKEMQKLEQEYTGTIIDTDDFQRYLKYHNCIQKIYDYIYSPDQVHEPENVFLRELAEKYRQYCFAHYRRDISSGDVQYVYEFMKRIKHIYWDLLTENLNDCNRAAVAIQVQQIQKLKEQMFSNQEKIEKSPSAVIFQRKFHKRLFLEKEDGAVLAQVYVKPKCRIEKRLQEQCVEDVFDVISEFLESEKDVLIIEGVAGSGKSSLFSALSERYDSLKYYYIALKDLLREQTTVDFRRDLTEELGLDRGDRDKVLMMDGYDELHRHLNLRNFNEDLQWLCERGHKIILTTRPGYLAVKELSVSWECARLQLFDERQIEEWLTLYRGINSELLQETCEALMKSSAVDKLDEIRRIPIMLYVIANRNINVHTVSCMGDLYEQVFDNLKRDKSGVTTEILNRHYCIAQKMAYCMDVQNILQITPEEVEKVNGEEFDKTFYSSVYIENNIIEGKSVLEFVHKSILEFFAAKWLYGNLDKEENIFSVLQEIYISEELLEYLKYFYQKDSKADIIESTVTSTTAGLADKIKQYIRNGFLKFLENGIAQKDGWDSLENTEQELGCLFYNFMVLQKEVLGITQAFSGKEVQDLGKNLTFILRTYLLDGIAKPFLRRGLLLGENMSVLYFPSYMDFSGMNLAKIVWEQSSLRHISFNECIMNDVVFRCLKVECCDFRFTIWRDALLDKVEFDTNSLQEIRFDKTVLQNIIMPKGSLRIAEIQNCNLENVKFTYNNLVKVNFKESIFQQVAVNKSTFKQCQFQKAVLENVTFTGVRFIKCNFKGVVCRGRCVFERCNIDAETWLTNPELFEGTGLKCKLQAETAKIGTKN